MPRKDRLTVLDILRGDPDGKARSYLFDEEAFDLLEGFKRSKKLIAQLRERGFGKMLDEMQMQQLLGGVLPDQDKGKIRRTRIMEAIKRCAGFMTDGATRSCDPWCRCTAKNSMNSGANTELLL